MARERATGALEQLRPAERADVLSELLERHPDLRGEASAIAQTLIDDVSVEALAEEVSDRVSRSGRNDAGNGARHW